MHEAGGHALWRRAFARTRGACAGELPRSILTHRIFYDQLGML